MSGADLANLVNEAALFAVRAGEDQIHQRHFEMARDRVLMGARRESMALSDREKEAIAYHEAGHAVCAAVLPQADPVHKVTILPMGMALGVTQQLPTEDRHIYRQDYIEDSLVVRMGGRIAEELVFGVISTGANNDLVGSTELARKMVREWGMCDRVGPMAWGSQGAVFLGEDLMHSRDYSDETARVIDEEVERILRAAGGPLPRDAHRAPQRPRPRGPGAARARDHRRRPRSTDWSPSAARVDPPSRSSVSGRPATAGARARARSARKPRSTPPRRPSAPSARTAQPLPAGSHPPGVLPGSRASATAAHRSVAVTGPTKLAATTPVGVGHERGGHRLDLVAIVQGPVGSVLELLHGHRMALQGLGALPHALAGAAGGGREHGHQPRRIGAGEVVPVELGGDGVARAHRSVGPLAALQDGGHSEGHQGQSHGDSDALHPPSMPSSARMPPPRTPDGKDCAPIVQNVPPWATPPGTSRTPRPAPPLPSPVG